MRDKRLNRGVTLVSLIILIIVLLIISIITIVVVNQYGIIDYAKSAVNEHNTGKQKEEKVLIKLEDQIKIQEAEEPETLLIDINEIIKNNPMGSNEIKLEYDVTGDLNLDVKANYTIDLNNNTLYTNSIKNASGNIQIKNGTLKTQNGEESGVIYLSGNTTLNNVLVNSNLNTSGSIKITGDSKITGKVENKGNTTLMLNGCTLNGGLKISGGSVNTNEYKNYIYGDKEGILINSGGINLTKNTKVEGKEYGIRITSGVLNIYGGEILAKELDGVCVDNYSTVKITGGTITGGTNGYGVNRTKYSNQYITITGGSIIGGKGEKNF